jgi:hypothetical protein
LCEEGVAARKIDELHKVMKVYTLGSLAQSDTEHKTLITIELVPDVTDMNGFKFQKGSVFTSSFYREIPINAGKIVKICNLLETQEFKTTHMMFDSTEYTVTLGQFFKIDEYSYDKPDKHLVTYQYKLSAVEQSDYVSPDYNGVYVTHYPSGMIRMKKNYRSGNLHSCFMYRNDVFNTLEGVRIYTNGYVSSEYTYDTRERLIRQVWYKSTGEIYSKKSGNLAAKAMSRRKKAPSSPIPGRADDSKVEIDAAKSRSSASESTASESDDEGEEAKEPGPDAQDEGCGLRVKPKPDRPISEGTIILGLDLYPSSEV